MPFWKKPTIDDQVIDLKMSSKTLSRQYKKCMDESAAYEKKMKAVWYLYALWSSRKLLSTIKKQLKFMLKYYVILLGNSLECYPYENSGKAVHDYV